MEDAPHRSGPVVPDYGTTEPTRMQLFLRALRHRNYRLFFAGQLVSLIGTFLTQVATVWLVYSLTHKAWVLGVTGFVGQIPMFCIAPFAGVLVDRVNRRKMIVVTQILAMLQSFALAALALPHRINVIEIIALSLFQGLVNAFDMPARQAFLIEMVTDPADLANAIALNSTMVHGARLIGPALAGFLIYWVGAGWCFLLDGMSYIAVIAALLAMNIQPRNRPVRRSVLVELKEGLRYAYDVAPIRVLLLLMAVQSLSGIPAFTILMPIYGDYFGGAKHGAQTLGFLMAASGIGALAGALYLATRRTVVGLGRVIAVAGVVFGLALIAFSFSHQLWISLLIVPIGGCAMLIEFASANTVLQTLADDDKRGRVMSLFTAAFMGMTPFGNLLAGALAQGLASPQLGQASSAMIGASRTLLIAGTICVLVSVNFAIKLPGLRSVVRPIYIRKGIIAAEVPATAIQTATEVADGGAT